MRRNKSFWIFKFLLMGMFVIPVLVYSYNQKDINVGRYQTFVTDFTGMGQPPCWDCLGNYYYDGFYNNLIGYSGWWVGVRNWEDAGGDNHSIKITGAPHGGGQTPESWVVPDENGYPMRKYLAYEAPTVEVDGLTVSRRFPLDEWDEVNPDAIPGTADMMVESTINTDMGLTLHQRVLAWSASQYDDFAVYDWTFVNTGNTDADPEQELPSQTLEDLYILRSTEWSFGHWGHMYGITDWERYNWHSAYGERPDDSLRMVYAYSARTEASSYDNFGDPEVETGFIAQPWYIGEVYLHAPKSVDDPVDDPTQPQMTSVYSSEEQWIKKDLPSLTQEDRNHIYNIMEEGFSTAFTFYQHGSGLPSMDGSVIQQTSQGEPTHHYKRMDEMDTRWNADIDWIERRQDMMDYTSFGPYTLPHGDTLRFVFAQVAGSISPQKGMEVGRKWREGTAGETWPTKDSLQIATELVDQYPAFARYPNDIAPNLNDMAKDLWVTTSKDSLFRNASNAKSLIEQNYNVPVPPPPPSVGITSQGRQILIEWSDPAPGKVDHYKIYRALGNYYPRLDIERGQLIGSWEAIATVGSNVTQYEDQVENDNGPSRGQDYYYYVAAVDAQGNESARYLNRTTQPASLLREPADDLSNIRVVPNPYHAKARDFLYQGAEAKINFFNLPPVCTIKIYNETGDLIKTIEHTNRSGDEAWANPAGESTHKYMRTESGQIPVSGIYIAHIETPEGKSTNVKFIIIR
ncbi:MAG TPA: hypothetical protein VKA68_01305 [bacterium]|nr:hypothetical protein [bacterium]